MHLDPFTLLVWIIELGNRTQFYSSYSSIAMGKRPTQGLENALALLITAPSTAQWVFSESVKGLMIFAIYTVHTY